MAWLHVGFFVSTAETRPWPVARVLMTASRPGIPFLRVLMQNAYNSCAVSVRM
jgi:hypothetical protein